MQTPAPTPALTPALALQRVEQHLTKLSNLTLSDSDRDAEEARLLYWQAKYMKRQGDSAEAIETILAKAQDIAESARNADAKNPKALRSWIAARGELLTYKSKLLALGQLKPLKDAADKLYAQSPDFEHRAADRILAHLYRVVPGIVSFGDMDKAKQHAEKAYTVAPEYPENKLILAEYLAAQEKDPEKIERAKKLSQEVLAAKWDAYPIQELDWKSRAELILAPKGQG